ncbi:hypothetical protein GCM10010967_19640 [Dyadobacter beijingensis]|uniref:Membrane protein DUF2157 n=1 Tax=Dyadobacter beijingensis TaxID=365489 RepID=A0ABQ2HQV4_9BACT|nr:hypothetical protein [Dyadobacter beijingensis]GGM87293.1 hypothetical protein GCM10010967_19640 [Dyadobacter beijingensis]
MKKAYNQTWIDNLHIQQQAAEWKSKNLLTPAQEEQVKEHFPEKFYRPGLFVKIGLFCFAVVACSFFIGFLSLFWVDTHSDTGFSVLSLIACGCFIFVLEFLIRDRKLFHSGVDNALLYAAVAAAMVPMFMLFNHAPLWAYCLAALAIIIPATLRYADLLGPIAIFGLVFTLLTDLMMKFALGKALLPFAIMVLSVCIYILVRKSRDIYYRECRQILEVLSLVTFYLGGNYLVVREANAIISGLNVSIAPQIAFAPLFYFFTLAIPVAYIVSGLKKPDRMLLIVGLLAFAFSIHTYFHYFSILTVSQGLTLAGALMIAGAVALIKYLHTPKHGISDEQDRKNNLADLQALIAAEKLGVTPHQPGLEFGGGTFGGGGAGEVY